MPSRSSVPSHTIQIKSDYMLRKELVAAGVITPGDLVEITSAGLVQRHSTENGTAVPWFALENDLVGEGIDDDYAVGDTVQIGAFKPGDEVNANVEYGAVILEGAFLTSGGAGKLQAAAGSADKRIVAQAYEPSNANQAGTHRVRVQIV